MNQIRRFNVSKCLARLKFTPTDGMTVLVTGRISVYPKKGRYSITAVNMEEAGLGDAYLSFLQLKENYKTKVYLSKNTNYLCQK